MKFEPLEHRSDDWFKKRLGMPTASEFHRIITPGGRPSASAPLYMAELVAEKIFRRPMEKDISGYEAVRWGIEHEDEAANELAHRIGPLEPGGFMTDDTGRYGASPDRLFIKGNHREVCEIKCPFEIRRHVANLLFDMDTDHYAQVQGQLLVSGYDVAHFFSYHPACPTHHQRVARDDKFIATLRGLLEEFCEELEANYQRALAMGEWDT